MPASMHERAHCSTSTTASRPHLHTRRNAPGTPLSVLPGAVAGEHDVVVAGEHLGPFSAGELAAVIGDGGELTEVGGAVGTGGEQHQHGRRGAGGVREAVDAAR